jgi:multiple antibiotic resistance protein
MKIFLLCFIPLFVAVDTPGNLPIFLSLTEGMLPKSRRKVIWQACWTAIVVSFLFMLTGKWIFSFLHITTADFKIAGGLILLFIAVTGILPIHRHERYEGVGIVPLGIPLMMGPAALTTLLIQIDLYPIWWVTLGLVTNIVISFLAFYYSWRIAHVCGINGMKAVSKVIHLFLAAIAVMMIRVGIQSLLNAKIV